MSSKSANFSFLAAHDERLVQFAVSAEGNWRRNPRLCVVGLRTLTEALVKHAAAYSGLYIRDRQDLGNITHRLKGEGVMDHQVYGMFTTLREQGNAAAHVAAPGQPVRVFKHGEALQLLRVAREVALWFHRTFKDIDFKSGPFTPPPDPNAQDEELRQELERLRAEVTRTAEIRASAAEQAHLRQQAEDRAAAAYADSEAAMELAEEASNQLAEAHAAFEAQLADVQARAVAAPVPATIAFVDRAKTASAAINLDEAATRVIIDNQLRQAGWSVDSTSLRYSKGVRPAKGKNTAIAEWPTASGPADYVLFVGLMPVAVVEAKRIATNVQSSIGQAERYSRDIVITDKMTAPGGPWATFKVPFVFATNGRPFLRQHIAASGIWFRDARRSTNHSRAVEGWYTPDGLGKLLKHDLATAERKLGSESPDYLPLRDYQRDAITAVETAILSGRRNLLLAMATGTGKTRTAICMVYRLIKSGRFNRVLFLVDRTSLGEQAHQSFENVKLEQLKSFHQIYDVKGLGDIVPDSDTRLHIATIQGMVMRLLFPSDSADPVPVDQYDCIVVDECHRGYHLDREMSETELTFRSEADYISKYRRVLDHFDAVRVGLTATPALHTTDIFGDPVYTYSYRQAVIDGYLVDHEPPIRIITALAEDGITWLTGDKMEVYKVRTQQLDLIHAPDDVKIELERFNRVVVTKNFNRVVCEQLAQHIDPSLPGKTIIFCATDAHADQVVTLLKAAFVRAYGPIDDDAVKKITGNAPKPSELIRHYKNEPNPRVAVTVDLLTTGIDVPEIVNVVFLRRVRSRILYEQMMGRATRLCPDIGKQYFRIFDAVDLYAALLPHTAMRPVVENPKIPFSQLAGELATVEDDDARKEIVEQLAAKLQRKARSLEGAALDQFVTMAGMAPKELVKAMQEWGVAATAAWFGEHPALAPWLDSVVTSDGPVLIISSHADEHRRTVRGYGDAAKPEDYLESFSAFIKNNLNELPALKVVTQRPRDLTREQLKGLKLELDKAGFTEATLRVAVRETTNQDIAATIIGYVRQQALGSALVPYDERVRGAMKRILSRRAWTMPQRKWLERIGKQLMVETIVDHEALDRGQFKAHGGFNRMNKVFGGQLEDVLGEIADAVWADVG